MTQPPLTRPDPPMTLRLTGIGGGGEALGRLGEPGGLVVFVPGGAPGDLVEIDLIDRRKGYGRGRLLRVLEPSPSRVTPACPLLARCGGCPLMQIDRPAQLRAKEELLRSALRHSAAAIRPILAPTADLGYRVRARFVQRGGRLGFQAGRSHDVAPVSTCPVLVPALDRALQQAGAALSRALGEEGMLAGLCGVDGAVHLCVTAGVGADGAALSAGLQTLWQAGAIAGAVLRLGPHTRRFGADTVPLGLDGGLRGGADGFAQASAPGHDLLPALVAQAVDPLQPRTLLELYAGSGNLTRRLLQPGRRVVAVEGDQGAAARLSQGGGGQVRAQPAERAVAALVQAGAAFDIVVLDPPRGGAPGVVPQLAGLRPARVVYVSCDPMTLGRDVVRLCEAGYTVTSAQPVDLMPHTAQVEAVAVLDRREA